MSKTASAKVKKPLYKRYWVWFIILSITFSIMLSSSEEEQKPKESSQPVVVAAKKADDLSVAKKTARYNSTSSVLERLGFKFSKVTEGREYYTLQTSHFRIEFGRPKNQGNSAEWTIDVLNYPPFLDAELKKAEKTGSFKLYLEAYGAIYAWRLQALSQVKHINQALFEALSGSGALYAEIADELQKRYDGIPAVVAAMDVKETFKETSEANRDFFSDLIAYQKIKNDGVLASISIHPDGDNIILVKYMHR